MPETLDAKSEAAKQEAERREEAVENGAEMPERTNAQEVALELAQTEQTADETREAIASAVREFPDDPAAGAELTAISSETELGNREVKAVTAEIEGKPPVKMEVAFTVLPETGLTQDYNNEFAWITGLSDMEADEADEEYEYLSQKASERKGGKIMRDYQEVYQPGGYEGIVTEKNAAGVAEINAVVKEINDLHADGKLTRQAFLELSSKINGIITGGAK